MMQMTELKTHSAPCDMRPNITKFGDLLSSKTRETIEVWAALNPAIDLYWRFDSDGKAIIATDDDRKATECITGSAALRTFLDILQAQGRNAKLEDKQIFSCENVRKNLQWRPGDIDLFFLRSHKGGRTKTTNVDFVNSQ